MSADDTVQLDAFITPGTLLKAAREDKGLSQREVADRLHLMPGYPAIIERDDFKALLHPAFARGYVRAYGKLVGVEEQRLLSAFDRLRGEEVAPEPRKIRDRPLQLHPTGLGVVIGLVLLVLLVLAIWWFRAEPGAPASALEEPLPEYLAAPRNNSDFVTGDR
ncbi:MAG: helix-turn-helix domain-containing protein [Pseudomonadales bacterium]|nr:helix-turn-helix domain-containing protein [Pseudomonadales bacterium]